MLEFLSMELWQKQSEEMVFQKYGRSVLRRIFTLPNGKEEDFYITHGSPSVCVLALTAEREVILAKQFRPGPEAVLLELPGGSNGEDESPEGAAARELLEETGFAGDVTFVGRCFQCAYDTSEKLCFVATNCKKMTEPHLDPGEFVEVVTMPFIEFRTHLRSGQLTDVNAAYLGLDYLGLL